MPKVSKPSAEDKTLLIILSEASARKKVAKATGIRSGCLPALAGLVYRCHTTGNTRPQTIYQAKIGNQRLVRSHLRELIAAGLVQLQILHGTRWLSPTLAGLSVAAKYTRQIRTNSQAFTQV